MRKLAAILALIGATLVVVAAAAPPYAWGRGFHRHPVGSHHRVIVVPRPAFWLGPPWWGYYPTYVYGATAPCRCPSSPSSSAGS